MALPLTVISISERLRISKIYLEQVFSLLRRGGLVLSIKGSQGGYQLSRPPAEINAAEILSVTETTLFEEPESTVTESEPGIEAALQKMLFRPANKALRESFGEVTLADLTEKAFAETGDDYLYFI